MISSAYVLNHPSGNVIDAEKTGNHSINHYCLLAILQEAHYPVLNVWLDQCHTTLSCRDGRLD